MSALVDWDFILQYKGESPFKLGDKVPSGTKDHYGKTVEFPAYGVVVQVSTKQEYKGWMEFKLFVKIVCNKPVVLPFGWCK